MLQGRELQVKYHPEYLPALWPRMMHETLSFVLKVEWFMLIVSNPAQSREDSCV